MKIDKKDLTKIVQEFNDGAYSDEKLQALLSELYETERLTGIKDELLMTKIFDYLDTKLQGEIRSNLH